MDNKLKERTHNTSVKPMKMPGDPVSPAFKRRNGTNGSHLRNCGPPIPPLRTLQTDLNMRRNRNTGAREELIFEKETCIGDIKIVCMISTIDSVLTPALPSLPPSLLVRRGSWPLPSKLLGPAKVGALCCLIWSSETNFGFLTPILPRDDDDSASRSVRRPRPIKSNTDEKLTPLFTTQSRKLTQDSLILLLKRHLHHLYVSHAARGRSPTSTGTATVASQAVTENSVRTAK